MTPNSNIVKINKLFCGFFSSSEFVTNGSQFPQYQHWQHCGSSKDICIVIMIVHYNFPHHCCTTLNLLRFCNQGQSTRYHCRLDTKNSNSATRKSFKKIAPHLVQVLKGVLTNLSVYYLAIKAYLELFMTLWMWVWYPLKWGSNAVQNGNEIPTRLKMVGLLSTPGANNNLIASHRAMTRNWSRL